MHVDKMKGQSQKEHLIIQKRVIKINGEEVQFGVIWDHMGTWMELRKARSWEYVFFSRTLWEGHSGAGWRYCPSPENVAISEP